MNRIYRELKYLNSQRINDSMKKWANELNISYSKEEVEKHMKKCSISLTIKEIHIKIMLKFYLTPVRMAVVKYTNNNKCRCECRRKRNTSTQLVGM
jgi:hypothetical protein